MTKSKKQNSGNSPSIKISTGSLDKSDFFIGIFGFIVIVFIIVYGNNQYIRGPDTVIEDEPILNVTNNDTTSGTTTTLSSSDKDGTTSSQDTSASGSTQNLKEIDNQKFTIGESMVGNSLSMYGRQAESMTVENSAADAINDEAKKARKDIIENSIADELVDKRKVVGSPCD